MDDATFKKLFSHRRMIELLIRRQIPEWDGKIEYTTLERLPTELIDERLRRRYADMIWRARTDKQAPPGTLKEYKETLKGGLILDESSHKNPLELLFTLSHYGGVASTADVRVNWRSG